MYKIEYEIDLNEKGRPYINLLKDYEDKPEDKFLAIELSRYILQNVYDRRSTEFDEESAKVIDSGIRLLGQVGDEIAVLLWEQMKIYGDASIIFDSLYHVSVKTIEERNNLNYDGFLYNNKIYKRQEGLKVMVEENMKIYKLVDGIDNENWGEVI